MEAPLSERQREILRRIIEDTSRAASRSDRRRSSSGGFDVLVVDRAGGAGRLERRACSRIPTPPRAGSRPSGLPRVRHELLRAPSRDRRPSRSPCRPPAPRSKKRCRPRPRSLAGDAPAGLVSAPRCRPRPSATSRSSVEEVVIVDVPRLQRRTSNVRTVASAAAERDERQQARHLRETSVVVCSASSISAAGAGKASGKACVAARAREPTRRRTAVARLVGIRPRRCGMREQPRRSRSAASARTVDDETSKPARRRASSIRPGGRSRLLLDDPA